MKISILIPYKNRNLDVFKKLVADSLSLQEFDEIHVCDFGSTQNRDEMKDLCIDYNFKYSSFDFEGGICEAGIDIFLWNTLLNKMIKDAKGDVIIVSGIDKMFQNDVAEWIEETYEAFGDMFMIRTKAWQTKETTLPINETFNDIASRCYIRGYGFWGATKKMFHHCRGIREDIRWFEELELFGRGKLHKIPLPWINNGKKDFCRIIHFFGTHLHTKNVYYRDDIRPIFRLAKTYIRDTARPLQQDLKDWGIITNEKLERADKLGKGLRRKII